LFALARATGLDASLADGADPSASAAVAARASVLGTARARAQLADALDALVTASAERGRAWAVRPHRGAIAANVGALRDLSALLRDPRPVYVRGIAMLNRLLRDGTGPVFLGDGARLAAALDDARRAMGSAPAVQRGGAAGAKGCDERPSRRPQRQTLRRR
jgi:hypothetical protein